MSLASWQPRHYTLEVSEEGRQWMLVHRCIVDPAKGEGDKVLPGEEHLTAIHQVRVARGQCHRDHTLPRAAADPGAVLEKKPPFGVTCVCVCRRMGPTARMLWCSATQKRG